ncbi:MAG: polysaccharide deacetylase family protein [Candidatus Marinimicrobia bacterium]|nr:polysaccharide deacetylase family protein [Candidatus Neomarinimicrobiota bacterium]
MKRIIIISILILVILAISCSHIEDVTVPNGGVVITLDDHHFINWCQVDSLLKKYNWKASFCVSLIGSRSDLDIQRMHELYEIGHEISGHGYMHVHSVLYVATHGMEKYLEDEIIPMMDYFDAESLNVRSFSYPHGSRNNFTDNELLDYFDILRATSNGVRTVEKSKCYFDGSPIVYSLGLDDHFSHYSEEYFIDLLTYAHEEGKIIIFHGHKPVETVTGKYQVSFQTLDMICKYAYDNNMNFYTLSDLAGMIE